MTVEIGLVMPAGPKTEHLDSWASDIDESLRILDPYISGLWMTDHFIWDSKPTYEAWTALVFAAAQWSRYTIGPIVLSQGYRNPALLAKMSSTLQSLCGGRLLMGIGAGWKEDEYHAYNFPFPSPKVRVEQLEDTLEILTRMWSEPGKVSYVGKHYQVKDAYCEPKPDPIPTLVVGGGGHKTMMLAARFADWWNIPDANFSTYRERLQILHAHCNTIWRDPSTLRLNWFGRLAIAKTEAEAIALSDGEWTKDRALVGTPQQVVDQIAEFVAIGVDYFMLEILGAPRPDVMQMVREEVLSHFVT